ncbi:hypothetical protein JVT61DRAFT_14188 [Boletus reticuloceps]|uniref:Nudix hydrolase domain-containing protein n=1 Tax=Boletus reticuloceps TaxID=495285 RepID=A0A8I2YCV9_9AGAM|nr:hypothetical protein JVT61DRAFT_14188 [Boletus reticuloceps]
MSQQQMPSDSDNVPRRASRAPNFMTYPYPDTEPIMAHVERLSGVKQETKACIHNLLQYRAVRTRARLPRGQSAAVLVPLFVGRSGDLYVLLSRRSDALNAFAGDTALPGGKVDVQDVTVEDTARREAFEEIGLPVDKARVPLLCVMEPHLAKGETLVTPVVVLVLDNSLQPNLNSSEVTSIFAQPLSSFLSSKPHLSTGRTADPKNPYHTFTDIPWSEGGAVRLHRFLTGRESEGVKPVFGLTASILIKTATIGYGRPPEFEVQPPNAPTPAQQIALALLTPANPVRIACEREGVDANKAAARLLRPPLVANAPRTIEWEKIGVEWKKLLDDDNVATVDAAIGKRNGSGRSRSVSRGRTPGGDGVQKRIEEIKKRVQEHMDDGEGTEGLNAKIEEYKKQARERGEQTEESSKEHGEREEKHEDTIPDIAKLGEFLDKTRDMVSERMKEVKSDEKKLAKARKAYPKITEQVRKQLDEARDEDGEFDPKALFGMIPKEGQEGLKNGIKSGKEGIRRGNGDVDDGEGGDQGIERGKEGTRRGLEEMRKYIDKGGDGHNPEQAVRRKRDAKL